MTTTAAVLDAGQTLRLSHLDKPWYFHCNEYNDVPMPIPSYSYTVINRSLLCDCQIQEVSEFVHESLFSRHLTDKVDRNVYFAITMTSAYQLQKNFPEAIHSEEYI